MVAKSWLLCGLPARLTVPSVVLVGGGEHPVRREALDRERPADADALVVLVGLVVEHLGLGVAGDGGVDLLRASCPSLMSGLLAMDLSVTCGTRL